MEEKFISSTTSSVDSGIDNGYLSDNNSLSSNGKSPQQICVLNCVLSAKKQTSEKDSKHLCVLNHYDLSGKNIENISPITFQYLTYCVTELNLSRNKIQILPETICLLENLEQLNLSCNYIENIPESYKTLCKLKVLNLSNNKLKEIPKCLEVGMDRLTHIDLSLNKISNCLKPPKCLYFLQYLNLSHNVLSYMPLWLFTEQCRSLEELDLSFNFCFGLKTVDLQISLLGHLRTSVMKSLKKLSICNTGSKIDMISCLSQFESLESYNMGNKDKVVGSRADTFNHFWDFPIEFFYNPKTVVELYLPDVGLAGLPNNICKLESLKVLDVSANVINWLPDSFGLLKSLEELNLSSCKLVYLPENFNALRKLKKLLLDHNELTDVRKNLEGLSSLEWLDLYNNSMDEFPLSLAHLVTLNKLDVAENYVSVEEVFYDKLLGVCSLDIYYKLQANLRSSSERPAVDRLDGHKISSSSSNYDSPVSELSYDEDSEYNNHADEYQEGNIEPVEENWDDDYGNDDSDQFEPNTLNGYYFPRGLRPFGWIPPKKQYEYKVPLSLMIRGFIYVPGESHVSPRRFMTDIQTLDKEDGQFDDFDILCASDLDKEGSFIECLEKKFMFVRHPLGVQRRNCTRCSRYDYCWHNGIWSRF